MMELFKKRNKKVQENLAVCHSGLTGIRSDAGQASMTTLWIASRLWARLATAVAALLLAMTMGLTTPFSVHAQPLTPSNKFPRTANIYLSTIKRSDYDTLAQYDLLVLIPEIQYYNPDFFAYARAKNPNIIILPYIYSSQVNIQGQDDIYSDLKRAFAAIATPERYLYTPDRQKVNVWNNIVFLMNPTTDWNTVMPTLVKQKILDTGLWDGIFYDIVDASITHFANGNLDINNDGVRDDPAFVNGQWQHGMEQLLANTRQIIGDHYYIVTNGDSLPAYQPPVNGRMFEAFPTPWEGGGHWFDTMRSYFRLPTSNFQPPTSIINTTTHDHGNAQDYQTMRFGLSSALLGQGYSSFDFGITSHAQLWVYDEYKSFLGRPVSAPTNLLTPQSTIVDNALWRRDFEQGVVFVNSSDRAQTVKMDEEFEKIHGTQDPSVNDGSVTSDITLSPNDGVLLLRPIERLVGSPFLNGSFARVFLASGDVKRTGFFTYTSMFRGRATVALLTPAQSPTIRYVVAENAALKFLDENGKLIHTVSPYTDKFPGTFTFALGDLYGDGQWEVVTVPTSQGSVHVRSFHLNGQPANVNFIANKKNGSKGSIAVLSPNAGQSAQIVLGARSQERPWVSFYAPSGKLIRRWGAFENAFLGGVNVAAGDVTGNGTTQIIAGRGAGGRPEVRLFTTDGKLTGLFNAFDASSHGGVNVIANDIDGDGKAEILATTTKIFTISSK